MKPERFCKEEKCKALLSEVEHDYCSLHQFSKKFKGAKIDGAKEGKKNLFKPRDEPKEDEEEDL